MGREESCDDSISRLLEWSLSSLLQIILQKYSKHETESSRETEATDLVCKDEEATDPVLASKAVIKHNQKRNIISQGFENYKITSASSCPFIDQNGTINYRFIVQISEGFEDSF